MSAGRIALYVLETIGLGIVLGLVLALLLFVVTTVFGRSGRWPWRIGVLVGIDIVALVMLWAMPVLS